jgi:hypothetical protein
MAHSISCGASALFAAADSEVERVVEIQLEDAMVDRDSGYSLPVYPEAIALERAGDRLPDPPGGVRGELAAAPVKLLDRADQAEVARLD